MIELEFVATHLTAEHLSLDTRC